ncbi:MAG: aminomethyltransferase family protein [Deltaproteobacteria bacterium]|nr:MAG: aminomethyltransferase family protein [Deltaproteobacteria bacterium]
MKAAERARAVRRGAGFFELAERGLLEVTGGDARRWLDGMISQDVTALEPGAKRSGCYALLLTPQGRVVADLHVLLRPQGFWLELDRAAVAAALAHLERYIVADDVALCDRSGAFERFALEGPRARAALQKLVEVPLELAPDACVDARVDGAPVVIAAFGWTGESAFQVFAGEPEAARVRAALRAAREAGGWLDGDPETLELLRIEAGIPRFGAELDASVLPDEARLDRAISTTKGCYTGQEVVARMRSRGRVSHRLVGLALDTDACLPEPGTAVHAGEASVGEITSAALSARAGAIALAFVRTSHHVPGTTLSVAGRPARVVELPFVEVGAAPGA